MRALQLIEDRKLEIVDVAPPPPPDAGEVTVNIKAVALNHIDVWGWRGMAFAKRKMPLTIGAEASGVVDAIGPGVSNLLPGQLVSIYGAQTCGLCRACREGRDNLCEHVSGVHGFHLDGFAQEKVNLKARLLVPAPPGVDEIGAAVAPVTFGTVEHMLFDNAKLEPGETILVHAGGSGIGSAAIQLAKKMGCTVITTVGSDNKIEKAKELGADHVINYREDRFEGVVRKLTKKKGVDVVFEHVGADTWAGSMLSLRRGGRLVTCGSTSGVSTSMNLMMLFQQQLKLLGSFGCRMENMADAMQKMARGLIKPVIDTEVSFDDIDTALKRMEGRDVFGKIILRVN
ncbi:zinc-binding dehydrogenase [Phyllobacterium sp. YR531]|uniref:zinc-binding dehydrogenase n=1 Tax=Phyllobacterium sp. YR531 TaxID=1144343 RepID=UPI00026F752D|nr:zinc-binding dehydrogenase [Phyllobacterium sp. YR531]EJN03933.1 Zn-dependent oxidoreductase, NADPH:quinone reductase [Phyllobacterium sp. YR531]